MFPVRISLWRLVYTIKDDKGRLGRVLFYLPRWGGYGWTIEPEDDPEYYAWILAVYLDRIITGQIVNISLSTEIRFADFALTVGAPVGFQTLKSAPAPQSDVEEGVRLTYYAGTTASGKTFQHVIPTIDEGLLLADGSLDDSSVAVGEFLSHVSFPEDQAVPVDWGIGARDGRGDDLVGLNLSEQVFKQSKRQKR